MINHLLIITKDLSEQEGILDEVTTWATDRDGTVNEDTWVRSAEDALSKLCKGPASDIDLVITRLDIPRTRKTPLNHADDLGLEIIREMRDRNFDSPAIIIADEGGLELTEEVQELGRCHVISAERLSKRLKASLDLLIPGKDVRLDAEPDHRSELDDRRIDPITPTKSTDIVIVLKQNYHRYRIGAISGELPKFLNIDEELIKTIKSRTKRLYKNLNDTNYEYWDEDLKDIGIDLRRALFGNPDFNGDFKKITGSSASLSNTHLHFVIGKDAYPLAVEALYGDEWKWWMLEAPITRRLELNGWAAPLFEDEQTLKQPLKILVIEANTEGFAWPENDTKRYYLPRLENVAAECEYLKGLAAAETVGLEVQIASVVSIPDNTGLGYVPNFRERVKAALTSRTEGRSNQETKFHIVHFAGHSIYDESKDESYLCFPPADEGGQLDTVPAEHFATWLKAAGARFVYLSCCKGSEAAIVHELASRHVPAILGFRWDIDDGMAAMHARKFYDHLLKERPCLEDAFLKARKDMYEQDRKNRIWAAPIMILQTNK
jgi:hypothetical protein